MDIRELHVSIGEIKIGEGNDILKASLGSCVGIALLWKSKKIYGLAHCLLPEGRENSPERAGRFASQAVPSLIQMMGIRPNMYNEIDAVLVGGGNMTAPMAANPQTLIGHLNIIAAEKYLKQYGFQIVLRDVGGQTGKKILVFCETGTVSVSAIPRLSQAS